MYFPARASRYLFVAFLVAALAACGGQDNAASGGSGSVAILFTDAPADDFSELNVTVNRVVLLGENDQATEIFSGAATINFLDLAHHADLFSLTGNVPAGTYHKVRLYVDDVELVRKDNDGNVIEVVTPKLPGNGKLDLNPRGAFEVHDGQTLMLEIDLDAHKSIHYHALGNGGYILRPVIFVKPVALAAEGKLVRVSGEIRDLDATTQRFRLCRASFTHRENAPGDASGAAGLHIGVDDAARWCPTVQVSADTSFFDGNGDPLAFDAVEDGQTVTVFGRFAPAATDAERPTLNALTVLAGPAGSFRAYSGIVATALDDATAQFGLQLDADQGIAATNSLNVRVQDGTKIVSRNGELLDTAALAVARRINVLGVLALSDSAPDIIKAAVIFVDTEADDVELSGTISAATGTPLDGFTLVTNAIGDRCVTLTSDTIVFDITTASGGVDVEQVDTSALAVGDAVQLYGNYGVDGCLIAETIIVKSE